MYGIVIEKLFYLKRRQQLKLIQLGILENKSVFEFVVKWHI